MHEQQEAAPKPARRRQQNRKYGKNEVAIKKTRAKKQAAGALGDAAVSTNADVATPGSLPRKRVATRKSTSSTRRKTANSVKKGEEMPQVSAAAAETPALPPVTSILAEAREAEADGATFEPDLEPTPVKARGTPGRSLVAIEAELDALLSEPTLEEASSEFEDTMALRVTPPVNNQTQAAQAASFERGVDAEANVSPVEIHLEPAPKHIDMQPLSSADTFTAIPETSLPLASKLADTPETPLPPVDVAELSIPAEDERAWDAVVIEEEVEAAFMVAVKTPPAIALPENLRPRVGRRSLKRTAMLLALFVFIISSLLWWQNVNETHLYLYHIDAGTGQTLAQQDLGGYSSISALSNAAQDQTSVLLGVSSSPSEEQQVLSLAGSDTSWHITRQFAASPGRSSLSVGTEHVLAVEDGSGLQVMGSDGRALWQAAGDAPALGAHAFAPAFGSSTLYTITSASKGVVVAYNARSGSARWTVQLRDTLNYAPPVLLIKDTLYVAGDHTLYALNSSSGGTQWKIATSARTLLFSRANAPAIITVGASGLAAFNAQSGTMRWSFNGQPDTSSANGDGNALTAAQFYQAGLLSSSNTVYATGLVWDTRSMQQQLWLFAVDAGSGKQLWSERIGTGFTNADGGRVFAPFIDAPHKLIVIEQAQSDGSHTLSAYDTGDGFQRWSMRLAAVSASTPAIIQLTGSNLGLFSAQTGADLPLRSGSELRSQLLILAIASLLLLFLLWIFPLKTWLSNTSRHLRRLPHYMIAPLRAVRRLWRFSRILFALTLAAAFISAGTLTYTQLNQQRPYVKQVRANNGHALWQQAAASSKTLAGVDYAGTLFVSGAGDHTFALSALNSNGSSRWTMPSGEGTFSFPQVATQAGTTLTVLNGPATLAYHYAPEDPAYPNPLAHYFALYLLDSHTGQVLWRNELVKAGALLDATLLGADSQFIYMASRSLVHNQVAQIIAVDRASGNIVWRFYGPREQANAVFDLGTVHMQGRLIYWQVDATVYALSTQTGQVEWRDALPEIDAKVTALEEGQMATGQGVLLVRRSDMYHALDLVTGAERWTLSGLGVDDTQTPGGIIAHGSTFILYGGGSIEAYDATTHSVLWKHINLVAVSDVSLSPDGSLVYAVVFNNIDGGTNVQALVAFDANSNLIHWTFQPGAQAQLVYAGSRIIYNADGMIYLASCFTSSAGTCNRQVLYGIDESTGTARWHTEASRIYGLHISQDGHTLTFQTSISAWENLKAIFRG